jgi:hypothetical protein
LWIGGFAYGPDANLYVASGASHEILRYNGSNGNFVDVFADVLASGGDLEPFQSHIAFMPAASILGDFDGNGTVNGADFLIWQRGGSPTPLSESDLAAWEANYGNVASPITFASTGVPEPDTWMMLMLGTAAMLTGRRPSVSKLNSA